jgi:hypothetical protein
LGTGFIINNLYYLIKFSDLLKETGSFYSTIVFVLWGVLACASSILFLKGKDFGRKGIVAASIGIIIFILSILIKTIKNIGFLTDIHFIGVILIIIVQIGLMSLFVRYMMSEKVRCFFR